MAWFDHASSFDRLWACSSFIFPQYGVSHRLPEIFVGKLRHVEFATVGVLVWLVGAGHQPVRSSGLLLGSGVCR